MKSNRFFILSLLAAIFISNAVTAQSGGSLNKRDTENSIRQPDLAFVSCTTKWLNKDQVQVTWTLRNEGTAVCSLTGKNGESLVSLIVDGTSNTASNTNWRSLLSADETIYIKYGDLRPKETATGSFVFRVNEGVWNHEEQLVSYRVTLDTDNLDTKELTRENNVYVGLIAKQ